MTIRRYAVAVGVHVRWQVVADGEGASIPFAPITVTESESVADFYRQAR